MHVKILPGAPDVIWVANNVQKREKMLLSETYSYRSPRIEATSGPALAQMLSHNSVWTKLNVPTAISPTAAYLIWQ